MEFKLQAEFIELDNIDLPPKKWTQRKGKIIRYVVKVNGLGRSDLATTLRYHADVFPEDLEEAAEMLAQR